MSQTKWNLGSLSDLQSRVVETFGNESHKPKSNSKIVRRTTHRLIRMATMAAAVTVMTIGTGYAAETQIRLPLTNSHRATQAVIFERSPLDAVFAERFTPDWSRATEDDLLAKLSDSAAVSVTKEDLLRATIESIFYNLQEDVSTVSNRLQKAEIAKIVKQRKLG